MSEVNKVSAVDAFKGDNQHLISCIDALLSLDAKAALVPHGVGGHARAMLSSAAQRLADFDRVTAERDALQALLTAADERAYTATSLIQRIVANFDTEIEFHEDVEPNDLEHDQVLADMRVFLAALKPAEPAKDEHVCTGCGSKGWTANCAECVPY